MKKSIKLPAVEHMARPGRCRDVVLGGLILEPFLCAPRSSAGGLPAGAAVSLLSWGQVPSAPRHGGGKVVVAADRKA